MSAAVRLDAVDYFPASSEDIIFNKFNVFVVPGKQGNSNNSIIFFICPAKIRFFFPYKTIVNYVKHGKDEQLAKKLISGCASRSKDTDYIISELSHIPLRI